MNSKDNIPTENVLLKRAEEYFKETFLTAQKKNIEKLQLKDFNYNPFLIRELATRISDNVTPDSLAKALVYPRILGTSVSTSFGSNTQNMIVHIMGQEVASTTSGMDIEYESPVEKVYRWAQIKSGPNTINRADVDTIEQDFTSAQNLARQNRDRRFTAMSSVCGVLYGTSAQLSGIYRKLIDNGQVQVLVGQDFWYDLTGYKDFYFKLITTVENASQEISLHQIVEDAVERIASEISKNPAEFGLEEV